jgi:hypothetical protein
MLYTKKPLHMFSIHFGALFFSVAIAWEGENIHRPRLQGLPRFWIIPYTNRLR